MAKVRCRFCEFEEDQKCKVQRGIKVKVNKRRFCEFYDPNEEKILDFDGLDLALKKKFFLDWSEQKFLFVKLLLAPVSFRE